MEPRERVSEAHKTAMNTTWERKAFLACHAASAKLSPGGVQQPQLENVITDRT